MLKQSLLFTSAILLGLSSTALSASAQLVDRTLKMTIKTTDTTEGGEDEVFFTVIDHAGTTHRVPSSGEQPMNEDDDIDTWVSTTKIKVNPDIDLPSTIFVWEDDTSNDDLIAHIIVLRANEKGSQKGIDGYTVSWDLFDEKNEGKSKTTSTIGKAPVKGEADVTRDRQYGLIEFKPISEDLTLPLVGSQTPYIKMNFQPKVATHVGTKYLNISMKGTTLTPSKGGAGLQFDRDDLRGWYMEYAEVTIKPVGGDFKLLSWGPKTTEGSGSVTSTSGIDFSGGGAVGLDGATPQLGANLNMGVNFGTSYSEDLTDFSVSDQSSDATLKTKYYLSSTSASETWSSPKGGKVPYSTHSDLIRMDAAGQFGGTPLNNLPVLAYENFPILSTGTWQAPAGFSGTVDFEVKVKMHLKKVEKTNSGFSVAWEAENRDVYADRKFSITF